jgi:hypothetical protein
MLIPISAAIAAHEANSAVKCPECGTKGYLIWPSYGNCQTCLKLRLDRLANNTDAD